MKRAKKVWLFVGILALVLLIGADVMRQFFASSAEETFQNQHGSLTPSFKLGDLAPDFTLPDASGKRISLSSLVKEDTLLCFLCGCDHCREMQINLGTMLGSMEPRPQVISVTTAPAASEEAWKRDTQLAQTMLYDSKEAGKPVTKQYRGDPCPRVFRLAAGRQVTWIGPSPAQVTTMDEYGEALAGNLGYRRQQQSNPSPNGAQGHHDAHSHDH